MKRQNTTPSAATAKATRKQKQPKSKSNRKAKAAAATVLLLTLLFWRGPGWQADRGKPTADTKIQIHSLYRKHTILEVEAKMTNDQRLSSDKRQREPPATTKIIYYCFKHLCFALKRDTFVSSMPFRNLFGFCSLSQWWNKNTIKI